MIGSINSNLQIPVRVSERMLPSEVSVRIPKPENKEEIVELSSNAKQQAIYLQMIGKLPEIREDVISRMKELRNPRVNYPPLEVIWGISSLIGEAIPPVEEV